MRSNRTIRWRCRDRWKSSGLDTTRGIIYVAGSTVHHFTAYALLSRGLIRYSGKQRCRNLVFHARCAQLPGVYVPQHRCPVTILHAVSASSHSVTLRIYIWSLVSSSPPPFHIYMHPTGACHVLATIQVVLAYSGMGHRVLIFVPPSSLRTLMALGNPEQLNQSEKLVLI